MIPKFRAYDSGSLSRMYNPDEVMAISGLLMRIQLLVTG